MAQKGNSAKFKNKLHLYYTYSLSIFLYNSEDYDEYMKIMSTSNKHIQYKTRGGGGGERKGGVIINFTDCPFSGDYMHTHVHV